MGEEKKEISVTLTYPHSDEFEFLSKIDIIDLDAEKDNDELRKKLKNGD